jgi:hypothetical protein
MADIHVSDPGASVCAIELGFRGHSYSVFHTTIPLTLPKNPPTPVMHLQIKYTVRNIYNNRQSYKPPPPALLGQELLERRLVNDDVAHGPQPLAAGLLLLQQLPPARDVAGVQLGQHVLAERLDGLARHDALARGSLDDDLCKATAVSRLLPMKIGVVEKEAYQTSAVRRVP